MKFSNLVLNLVLSITINLLYINFSLAQKIDNEILSIDIELPQWTAMTEVQLKEREEYAMLNAGRTIDYVAGFNHESGFPYVLLQSKKMNMSGMTPIINMKAIQKNSENPVYIDSIRPYVAIPPNAGETLFNVANKCGLSKYDITLDSEPMINLSYILLHGQGHVYMQCFTPETEMNRNFLLFEKIRKAIEWKVPIQEDGTLSATTSTTKNAVDAQNSNTLGKSTTSWAKWVVLGVIVLLLFILLIRNLKKLGNRA